MFFWTDTVLGHITSHKEAEKEYSINHIVTEQLQTTLLDNRLRSLYFNMSISHYEQKQMCFVRTFMQKPSFKVTVN